MKKLVVFDLDGTLAESKGSVDNEMARLLPRLVAIVKVAVISGGDWPQFENQLLANLPRSMDFRDLLLLPTCGTKFYRFGGAWEKTSSEDFTAAERDKVIRSLRQALSAARLDVVKIWGEVIEDRGSQITFSALGQHAPLDEKKKWDPGFVKRKKIKQLLDDLIPEFSVRLGGTTSIDVTRAGVDKAYGIRKLQSLLGVTLDEMLFVGDALFPGGNDFPVEQAGVLSIRVRDPDETKRVIETVLACMAPSST